MLAYFRKYQRRLVQTLAVLVTISFSLGAWASVGESLSQETGKKTVCAEHASASVKNTRSATDSKHDCCQQDKSPCQQSCCNHCVASGSAGLILSSSGQPGLYFYQSGLNTPRLVLPDGILSSTLFRPPQTHLI